MSFSRRPGNFAEVAKPEDACRVNSHSESMPVLHELREMVYYTIKIMDPSNMSGRDNLSFSRRPDNFAEVAKPGDECQGYSHSGPHPGSAKWSIRQLQTLDPL